VAVPSAGVAPQTHNGVEVGGLAYLDAVRVSAGRLAHPQPAPCVRVEEVIR